jgi:hypothetical protein
MVVGTPRPASFDNGGAGRIGSAAKFHAQFLCRDDNVRVIEHVAVVARYLVNFQRAAE